MYCKYESQKTNSSNVHVALKFFQKKSIEIMEVQFLVITLGEGDSKENDDSDFEILLHFEAAFVAE